MIHFILARSNKKTILNYLERQGAPIANLINVICYDEISSLNGLPCSALIFVDFERLNTQQLTVIKNLVRAIKNLYPSLPIYNDPAKVKLRFELLKQLFRKGINQYNVFRTSDSRDHIRYPVFLREECEHTGTLTNLIHAPDKLEKSINYLKYLGYSASDLPIVEYRDVSNARGQFHKYSAYKFGEKILPKNYDLGSKWVVKIGRELKRDDHIFKL